MTTSRIDHLAGSSPSDAWLLMAGPDGPPGHQACWPSPTDDEPEIDRCLLENRPVASGMARDFIHKKLLRSGLPELVDDAEMAVSELVTNALTHGAVAAQGQPEVHQPIQLVLVRHRRRLLIAVTDESGAAPVLKEPGPLAEGGRGLQVVQELSLAWGWAPLSSGGKAVWAMFPIREPSPDRCK